MKTNDTITLYALEITSWESSDYFDNGGTEPRESTVNVYRSREAAEAAALKTTPASDTYYTASIYQATMPLVDAIQVADLKTAEGLAEILNIAQQSTDAGDLRPITSAFLLANYIIQEPESTFDARCTNYDFYRSLESAVLVLWQWEKHIGYARKCLDIRFGTADDDETLLTKQDKVYCPQYDVLLTADEVAAAADDLQQALTDALDAYHWKWTNPNYAHQLAADL